MTLQAGTSRGGRARVPASGLQQSCLVLLLMLAPSRQHKALPYLGSRVSSNRFLNQKMLSAGTDAFGIASLANSGRFGRDLASF